MNAEQNLKERLASIIKVAQMEPFAKLASSDAQLDLVADAVLARKTPVAPVSEQKPVIQKTASVTDMSLADIIKDVNFQRGFADVMTARAGEIEDALAKSAAVKPESVAAGVGGAVGATVGYRNSRAAGKGRLASAASGAAQGVGGALLAGAATKKAPALMAKGIEKIRGAKFKVK